MNNKEFKGFYIAKVENDGIVRDGDDTSVYTEDTEKRGRVQVRVLGIHTEVTSNNIVEGIPIVDLPWAEPCMPLIGGGFGSTASGLISTPERNSFVYVFFLEGDISKPIYFGYAIGSNDFGSDYKDKITLSTRSGHIITINDNEDSEEITLEHKDGMAISLQKAKDNDKTLMLNITATQEGIVNITGKKVNISAETFSINDRYPITATATGNSYTIGGQIFKSS